MLKKISQWWSNRPSNKHQPSEAEFKSLAENSLDIILRIGLDGKMLYASPSSVEMLGWTPEEMLHLTPRDFVHPDDTMGISIEKQRILGGAAESHIKSFRVTRKDGQMRWLEGTAKAIHNRKDGPVEGLVVILRDVTERKDLETRLARLAMTDGLTGLPNRRAFDEALDREWQITTRRGTQMSLLLLDVDHFKGFNDQYGHQVGDDCLRAVAAAAAAVLLRPSDFIGRYGGEELVVVLPDTDGPGAVAVAERIRRAVQELYLPHATNPAGNYWVSVSAGVATAIALVGGTMSMPAGLLAAADTALYKAKQTGRNRVGTALLLTSST